jgi:hypothetical protein
VCPGGEVACPPDAYCALDAPSGLYECAGDCPDAARCGVACCPLGSSCLDGACALPDLTIDAAHAAATAFVDEQVFEAGACELVEGCIAAPGSRRLLRFALRTANAGPGPLVLGDPAGSPFFTFSPCHGHYHFDGFARYRLLHLDRTVAAVGHKQAFCLYDVLQVDPEASTEGVFTCEDQGLSVGWADNYSEQLGCQWVDVTGVSAGDYLLELTVNGPQVLAEADYGNNQVVVPVYLP